MRVTAVARRMGDWEGEVERERGGHHVWCPYNGKQMSAQNGVKMSVQNGMQMSAQNEMKMSA
ncbi:MAG: hypothetical protein RR379_10770 [Clostridia bacterium]